MLKTIVYIYDQAYISGGAAKIAIHAAIALKARGYRVIFFAAAEPVCSELEHSDVEVICIGGEHIGKTRNVRSLMKGIWNEYSKKRLNQVLSELDPETTVVHVHGWTKILSSSIFKACKENNMRTFITLHEYFTVCANGAFYNHKKGKICDCSPNSLKCIFCNCDKRNFMHKIYRNVRQVFTTHTLHKARPDVIYITEFSKKILQPYIDFADNDFLVENHVEIGSKYKVEAQQNNTYLFIGRMSDEKAPDLFCEAVTKAGVKGVVIGDGPKLEHLKGAYPEIEFTGWLDTTQMEQYVRKARCHIVTSKWYETMGLTIIEMQSHGIPCIVPDRCAGSDYIKDKFTGLIYKTGEVDSLVDAIRAMNDDDLAAFISDNVYNLNYSERFGMERHIDNLLKTYNT